jgi:serine/threonine protein kinase
MHSRRIIVVDVKPQNILVFEQTVKLCDLGLAEVVPEDCDMVTFASLQGTAGYFSPEQLRGERRCSYKIDVFAAGVTIFRLLAGYEPVYPAGHARFLEPYGELRVDFSGKIWNFVSPEMIDFIANCLSGMTESRVSSKEALDHPWMTRDQFPVVEKYPDPPPDLTIHFSPS